MLPQKLNIDAKLIKLATILLHSIAGHYWHTWKLYTQLAPPFASWFFFSLIIFQREEERSYSQIEMIYEVISFYA